MHSIVVVTTNSLGSVSSVWSYAMIQIHLFHLWLHSNEMIPLDGSIPSLTLNILFYDTPIYCANEWHNSSLWIPFYGTIPIYDPILWHLTNLIYGNMLIPFYKHFNENQSIICQGTFKLTHNWRYLPFLNSWIIN